MHDITYVSHRITARSAEKPVSIELARQQLRNEDLRADDALLLLLLRSSVQTIEQTYRLALLEQTVVQYHSQFPAGKDTPMLLRIAPLLSVTSIVYIDAAGATQTWSSSEYTFGHFNDISFVVPKYGYTYPTAITNNANAILITYEAGFGTKSENIPPQIIEAILLNVAWLYEYRENPEAKFSRASEDLLRPFYRFSC